MQPSDTAYPRFKTRLTQAELEQFYTPTDEELAFCANVTLSPTTRLGFVVLLKTFQRLGYFVPSNKVPEAIIEHIATVIKRRLDREGLRRYDQSEVRHKHLAGCETISRGKAFLCSGQDVAPCHAQRSRIDQGRCGGHCQRRHRNPGLPPV